MYIYDLSTNHLKEQVNPEIDNILLRFVRKEANDKENNFTLLNNKLRSIETYILEKENFFSKNMNQLQKFYFNFGELPLLNECVITERGLYGVLFRPIYDNTFYYFNPDSGVIFGEPYLSIDSKLPNQPLAYTCHIAVNEERNKVLTASRFTNTVHFYDLSARLRKVIFFGNKKINPMPIEGRGSWGTESSIKCFISVKATSKYVYCLYAGYDNVLCGLSKIVIFNWEGKHIRTLELDYPLTAFDVDKSDGFLLGITRRKRNTEIVQYIL